MRDWWTEREFRSHTFPAQDPRSVEIRGIARRRRPVVLSRGGNTVASQAWINFAWPGNTVLGRLDRRVREIVLEAGSEPRTTSSRYLARQIEPGLHAFLLLLGTVKKEKHTTTRKTKQLGVR